MSMTRPVEADEELEEVLLEPGGHGSDADYRKARRSPPLAQILMVIWISLRRGYSVWPAYTGQPEEAP